MDSSSWVFEIQFPLPFKALQLDLGSLCIHILFNEIKSGFGLSLEKSGRMFLQEISPFVSPVIKPHSRI